MVDQCVVKKSLKKEKNVSCFFLVYLEKINVLAKKCDYKTFVSR